MIIREALLNLDREKNPFTVIQRDSHYFFKIDSDLFQALWWLDYNVVHEHGIYFLTNSHNKNEVLHLKPVSFPETEGDFVELEFNVTST